MTDEELKAVRDRRAKATWTPWRSVRVADPTGDAVKHVVGAGSNVMAEPLTQGDAEFIAAAPDDVDALLAYVDELRREVAAAVHVADANLPAGARLREIVPLPEWLPLGQAEEDIYVGTACEFKPETGRVRRRRA